MVSKPYVVDTGAACSAKAPETPFSADCSGGPGEREMRDLVGRMARQQAQLGSQLTATMAALGTLTTAVARQNATISSLMEEVRRLREQGAPASRRPH
ncbi:hypothetical protein [Alsobacter sp. R-9]